MPFRRGCYSRIIFHCLPPLADIRPQPVKVQVFSIYLILCLSLWCLLPLLLSRPTNIAIIHLSSILPSLLTFHSITSRRLLGCHKLFTMKTRVAIPSSCSTSTAFSPPPLLPHARYQCLYLDGFDFSSIFVGMFTYQSHSCQHLVAIDLLRAAGTKDQL